MTRILNKGRAIVLIFAVAALAVHPVRAQTGDAPTPSSKSPPASASPANQGIGAGFVGDLISHFVAPRATAPVASKASPRSEGPARIWLRVPRDAKVWFNGQETTLTGRHRRFLSPTLLPGKTYSYKIRVRWTKDGKAVEEVRNIEFRAGESVPIDFTQPDDRAIANTAKSNVALSTGTAK
jgi:uncharacterized protein (TIGR03000 family)